MSTPHSNTTAAIVPGFDEVIRFVFSVLYCFSVLGVNRNVVILQKIMNNIDWKYCQENSDLILASGIQLILSSPLITHIHQIEKSYGNYLISHKGVHYYIGEAKELLKRIKQQFTENTSTFYNNYLKDRKSYEVEKISILEFELRTMLTKIGRKEIEEFGMVNLSTRLNKFERGKRKKIQLLGQDELWLIVQEGFEEILIEGEKEILSKEIANWNNSSPESNAGIYMVRNNKDLLYIGESSDVQERYSTHNSTTYFSALRRHIGTEILGFEFIDDKKRRFSETNDLQVTQYLKECKYTYMSVNFGRYELEEYLIRKHKPFLNRKENK